VGEGEEDHPLLEAAILLIALVNRGLHQVSSNPLILVLRAQPLERPIWKHLALMWALERGVPYAPLLAVAVAAVVELQLQGLASLRQAVCPEFSSFPLVVELLRVWEELQAWACIWT